MLSFGVTTVEAKSGYGLDDETEWKQLEATAQLQKRASDRFSFNIFRCSCSSERV